jgi:hypothetical protein
VSVGVGVVVSVGLDRPGGDVVVLAAAVPPSSVKPLARIARPPTMSATMIKTRPVLRFTRAILPSGPDRDRCGR